MSRELRSSRVVLLGMAVVAAVLLAGIAPASADPPTRTTVAVSVLDHYNQPLPLVDTPLADIAMTVYATDVLAAGPIIYIRDYAWILRIDTSAGTFRRVVGVQYNDIVATPELRSSPSGVGATDVFIDWAGYSGSMALDSNGRLLFSDHGSVYRLEDDATLTRLTDPIPGVSLSSVSRLALGADDTIYLGTLGQQLWKFAPGSTTPTVVAGDGSFYGTPIAGQPAAGNPVLFDTFSVLGNGDVVLLESFSGGGTNVWTVSAATGLLSGPVLLSSTDCPVSYGGYTENFPSLAVRSDGRLEYVIAAGTPTAALCRFDNATGVSEQVSLGFSWTEPGEERYAGPWRSTDSSTTYSIHRGDDGSYPLRLTAWGPPVAEVGPQPVLYVDAALSPLMTDLLAGSGYTVKSVGSPGTVTPPGTSCQMVAPTDVDQGQIFMLGNTYTSVTGTRTPAPGCVPIAITR